MKQKDILLIVIIVIISTVASVILTKLVIAPPKNRQQEVEVINPISAEFNKPDQRNFNTAAFNPTQLITIGENPNPNPFNVKQ